jgi:hypothetical protein
VTITKFGSDRPFDGTEAEKIANNKTHDMHPEEMNWNVPKAWLEQTDTPLPKMQDRCSKCGAWKAGDKYNWPCGKNGTYGDVAFVPNKR